ncbi:transposase [bacterium SCSIO 12643]|nr:transposase [bacterium SCSIO 12643]
MKITPLEPGNFYHYYNRGNNKENLFRSDNNYQYFISLMFKYLPAVADVYSYCLLPNHFHLILRIKDEHQLSFEYFNQRQISQPFSNFFNAYAKAFNKMYCRTGSLFQKHPKRIKVNNSDYLKNLIIYINTNSSHHGIANFETYKYSSYLDLISNVPAEISRKEVISLFDDVENFKLTLKMKKDFTLSNLPGLIDLVG